MDWLGWMATAVVVGSYFCKGTRALRVAQMAGALLWMTYGIVIHATPVISANVLVFCAAAWTVIRQPAGASVVPGS
jgi:Bacterial inner membrane protein